MRTLVALLVSGLLVAGLLAGCGGDDDKPVVAVFGDSLSFQAWPEIEARVAELGYRLEGKGVPGDAMCDAVDSVAEVMEHEPEYVVLAYVGNNVTECTGYDTDAELADGYEQEAERVAELTRDARVVLVGPPDMAAVFVDTAGLLRERYERVADRHERVQFVDGRSLLSPAGYAEKLPCGPSEGPDVGCIDGEILVRMFDGVHLDAPGADGYSGGAVRWADTIVSSIDPV